MQQFLRRRLRTDRIGDSQCCAEGPIDRGVCGKGLCDVPIESNEIGTLPIALDVLPADAAAELREIVLGTQFLEPLLTSALHTISARAGSLASR